LPLVAVQLLWLNLVTNGIQDVDLAFEKGHENLMNRPPRKPNESIFDRQMLEQMAVAAITMTALTFGLWYYHIEVLQTDMLIARSEVMMLFVLLQNFHLLNCRSERQSFFSIPVSTNPFLFVALLLAQGVHIAASYIPPVANALQIAPVPAKDWAMLLIMASSILVVMEVYKAIKRMRPA
ncbi:MAG TPA: cation-translocating P-type ATPase C-terminal domain-containing protein, partial [Phnomibacter sp.]|nr:cation-translocating P-type ATPase C-terminal domain-containing protein [Phnomibacter sp.]